MTAINKNTKEGDVRKWTKTLETLRLYTHTHTHTHTGDLLENKNRINKRDICINASNFDVQLKKKNNITTFEKHKSNVVGVGVPDDPKEKHKFVNKITSKNQTSNIKFPTSNAAITLIALIITIIVLLILAGVTLNMVMGENGIFGKANNAKNKTEIAQYEEELRMCVLELQTDAATSGTTFNMETIKNKFEGKVKELENTTEIEFPTEESETRLDGTYKGYEFYIDDKFAAHIGDKATGISLTTSIEPSGWTQGPVTAIITIKSNNGINKVEPDEGSKNGNNEYIITKTDIAENTSFKYTVTDGQGNTQTKTAVINTIDKNPPADFTITAENTEEGLRITGESTDTESGIDKYEYYAKKSTDSDYTKYDSNIITNLSNGTYSVYVVAYDKVGNSKETKKISITINPIYNGIEFLSGSFYSSNSPYCTDKDISKLERLFDRDLCNGGSDGYGALLIINYNEYNNVVFSVKKNMKIEAYGVLYYDSAGNSRDANVKISKYNEQTKEYEEYRTTQTIINEWYELGNFEIGKYKIEPISIYARFDEWRVTDL